MVQVSNNEVFYEVNAFHMVSHMDVDVVNMVDMDVNMVNVVKVVDMDVVSVVCGLGKRDVVSST